MKKIFALLLALVMVFSLVACASKTETPATETKTEETATETTTEEKTEEPAAEEEKAEEPAAEEGKVYNVAYLVNGNLGDKSFFDSAEAGLAQLKADGRIDYVTIEMGGTLSGEHGIGTAKQKWLEKETSRGTIGYSRRLRKAIDPKGLFNPSKLVGV